MIRVMIVDDHEMIRNGIGSLLRGEPNINVVETASNGKQAFEKCAFREVDVILMDMMMPEMNGVSATKAIKGEYPQIKVLVVTINDETRFIKEALLAGASGYLLKDSTRNEIIEAIEKVAENKQYFSPEIVDRISERFKEGKMLEEQSEPLLTRKETDVLRLIAMEFTNQEIAEDLNCAVRTVDTHRRNLIKKLKVRNVAGLVRYAIQAGLVND